MPKKKAKRVKVVKVVPVEPEKTIIELEIEGPPPPEIPAEPIEVDQTHPVVKWIRGLW